MANATEGAAYATRHRMRNRMVYSGDLSVISNGWKSGSFTRAAAVGAKIGDVDTDLLDGAEIDDAVAIAVHRREFARGLDHRFQCRSAGAGDCRTDGIL